MRRWRRKVVPGETMLLALRGAVCAGVWAAAASEHWSGPSVVILALVVEFPALAVATSLIQAWRIRAGRRAQPPTPYDIVAEAERVLAREEYARVTRHRRGPGRPAARAVRLWIGRLAARRARGGHP